VPVAGDGPKLHELVSASYVFNVNQPPSGMNRFRVFDFTHNAFRLDVAELVVEKTVSSAHDAGFRVNDDNTGKTVAGPLTLAPSGAMSFIVTVITGPEQPANNHDLRTVYDLAWTWKVNRVTSLGLSPVAACARARGFPRRSIEQVRLRRAVGRDKDAADTSGKTTPGVVSVLRASETTPGVVFREAFGRVGLARLRQHEVRADGGSVSSVAPWRPAVRQLNCDLELDIWTSGRLTCR
jgi:hypothetical protein